MDVCESYKILFCINRRASVRTDRNSFATHMKLMIFFPTRGLTCVLRTQDSMRLPQFSFIFFPPEDETDYPSKGPGMVASINQFPMEYYPTGLAFRSSDFQIHTQIGMGIQENRKVYTHTRTHTISNAAFL